MVVVVTNINKPDEERQQHIARTNSDTDNIMAKAAVLTAQQHPFETVYHDYSCIISSTDISQTNNLTAAELRYQQSTHALSLLYKEEEVRKMKVTNIMLGDDVDCLNEQLLDEAERGDAAEAQAQNWREEAVDATDRLERTLNELRARTRELETLKVGEGPCHEERY